GEPAGSRLRDYAHHTAYPCQEAGGVIFAFMGTGEPPLLPNYEVLSAPAENRVTTKHYHECNYLQGLEGNMDNVHPMFLHRFLRADKVYESHPTDVEQGPRGTIGALPEGYLGPTRVEETDFNVWAYREADDVGAPDLLF